MPTACTVNAIPLVSMVNATQTGLFLFFAALIKETKASTSIITAMGIYARQTLAVQILLYLTVIGHWTYYAITINH